MNAISVRTVASFGLSHANTWAAFEPGRKEGTKQAALVAFTATVGESACDATGHLSIGHITSLNDTLNSYHVMERLYPDLSIHVSVSLQSQLLRPIPVGEKIVVISTIDKMGKNLVYCKSDFYLDRPMAATEKVSPITTVREVKQALSEYEKLATGTHIKSILRAKQ
ncbi:thioesterase superfamily protein [Angomonas deanei]|uniref:Thioesterase superfamily n=1 Tax=Angomonas deanei TaxID=59799 RepID=A0A7G2CPM8_9TRYP|nr:thioesterase superfamily protein [Angomonas deanei]CAD2220924.1 hypothetical protein, conserved [Angomonas deanei]|eukprot:EPY42653.1 thioesterase superfamily protein [Angomonas deanei]